ncbi:AAA family ATPase [Actinomadura barringtoniae]|uniref:AAA family ATPase n=1 Tax=Actinomadura barringtoniae TaxID=1427535 RepID=A0A939P6M9_9ACTN|nr:AfsR/SARP family transcriptional regulator [Actinomadura barringtoniae]MBO2446547.1 AAA family ATPase [Actinomadura barringtoniae]
MNGETADLGGPRQRSVLARLVVARGQMVPAERLVDDLWVGEAPPRASAGLQSFVSHLRRALEPGRPPRTPAQVLVTAPPGYALRLPAEHVDVWRFDAAVDEAGELLQAGDLQAARSRAERALTEWRGPAYAEFTELSWAATEASRLEERLRIALERRAEAMLGLGAAAEAVPDLESHVAANPLREDAWRLLALALYRTGRQGDALGALRRARQALADELGVDPGPALRRVEADILAQAPVLEPTRAPAPAATAPRQQPPPLFVGRLDEAARLQAAARDAAEGRSGLVLVSGDAGMGKTALIEQLTADLSGDGWTCAWGRAPETGGAPAAWPWTELLNELTAAAPPQGDLGERLRPLLDDATAADGGSSDMLTGRFRLHLAVADYLGGLADRAPLLIVLDDLHWADEGTLALLSQLPARLRDHRVLIVGTFRTTETGGPLAAALAVLARLEPLRLELDGLAGAEVAELVRAFCSAEVGAVELAAIAERTGGNPFFTRETARLLDAEGAGAATRSVPTGVGDVLRRRVGVLPVPAQSVLRNAAVAGRDVDLGVLTDVSGGDEDAVIDAVEAGLAAGLVTEPGPGRVRFAHALVRDTLYDGLSQMRRTRVHGRVAAALEKRRPDESAAIAHHLLEAGDDPAKAVHYARLAAEAAEARYAFQAAADLWERAAEIAGPVDRLELDIAAIRALALSGHVVAARERRRDTIAAAAATGDPRLLGRSIVCFDVPTLWTSREYGTVDPQVIAAVDEALAGLDGYDERDEDLRVRLLNSLAIELEGEPGERPLETAREAVRAARALGVPELLAVALNGLYLNSYRTAGDRYERRRTAAELLDLATAHDLDTYRVLAHFQLQFSSLACLDHEAARRHKEIGLRLAEQHGLPLLGMIAGWFGALSHVYGARLDEAAQAYEEVSTAIGRTGIWSNERGMELVGIYSIRLAQGRLGELLDEAEWLWRRWPHVSATADLYALTLAAVGRDDEARRIVTGLGPVRRDYFFDLVMAFRGLRALALNDRVTAAEVYEALLPYEDHVTGGACAVASIGPVGQILGDLAVFLDRPVAAAGHYRQAAAVAERIGAVHWAGTARESLDGLGTPAA